MGRVGFVSLVRAKERNSTGNADCEEAAFAEDEDELPGPCKDAVRQYEPRKKMYLLFFMSTTVVACFCIFVVIPQLIDYFTSSDAGMDVQNSGFNSEKQSVIGLLDTERLRRNKERLEIMQKFDALQQNYKRLQIEYQKAQELYLKKLHSAYKYEEASESTIDNIETHPTSGPGEKDKFQIFDIDNNLVNGDDDDKSDGKRIPPYV